MTNRGIFGRIHRIFGYRLLPENTGNSGSLTLPRLGSGVRIPSPAPVQSMA